MNVQTTRVGQLTSVGYLILETFFKEVRNQEDSDEYLRELIKVLIQRYGLLYRGEGYKSDVQNFIKKELESSINKIPGLIVSEKALFLYVLDSVALEDAMQDLVLQLTWQVVEKVTNFCVQLSEQDAFDYFTAFENTGYQLFKSEIHHNSMLKDSIKKRKALMGNYKQEVKVDGKIKMQETFPIRLIQVVLTSMSQVALNFKFLIPRAHIFVHSILKQQAILREEIVDLAQLQVNILSNPAASTLLLL
ncbi:hypothetical protein FGO68_gene9173 [Halteria grandinella]|uniref:AP-5 complex subunit zeta-1 C-terminal TPR domain-containing protein n=1 Tax=Halteria grandinella TaxID=5974 RepID=A0A8J8NZF7_HALGN|nr:hypothetical protein FGO68_gene9173 [Halteria grandinella]